MARARELDSERYYHGERTMRLFAAEVLRKLPELMHVTFTDGTRAIPFEYAHLIGRLAELADELEVKWITPST